MWNVRMGGKAFRYYQGVLLVIRKCDVCCYKQNLQCQVAKTDDRVNINASTMVFRYY
jgi:hypothetical protein